MNRAQPDPWDAYDRLVGWTWHNVIHAAISAQRGQLWKALHELEQVRDRTIELRGLREGVETKRLRHVDRLSPRFLDEIQASLPARLEQGEIMRALREMTNCFSAEAVHLDELLDRYLGSRFALKLGHYLALFK